MAGYAVSVVSKLVNSHGTWLWDTPNMLIYVLKANLQAFYSLRRGRILPIHLVSFLLEVALVLWS